MTRALAMMPAALRCADAAAYLGVSRGTLLRHGPAPVKIGGCKVWVRVSLDQWLDSKAAKNVATNADLAVTGAIHAIREARQADARRR
jgi:predicted DNA-binding transcriptional regulator AlpA